MAQPIGRGSGVKFQRGEGFNDANGCHLRCLRSVVVVALLWLRHGEGVVVINRACFAALVLSQSIFAGGRDAVRLKYTRIK